MPRPFEPLAYDAPPADEASPAAANDPSPPEPVSGRGTALAIGAVLLLAAVAIPLLLHRAAWLEAEAIFAAWFAIWTAALWWFGYHGRPIERDWPDYAPLWGGDGKGERGNSTAWPALDALDLGGLDLGEGIGAIVLVLIVALIGVFVIGWLIPLLAVVLFTVMRALLGQSGRFAERVRGRVLASLAVAVGWAAIYTAPLAVAVWALHALA
ncbi:MAG: hypothetical protein U0838_17705 [Chloroflexota bacterium]